MREQRWGTVVLTGATSGIGKESARLLAARCERLIVQGAEPRDVVVGLVAELGERGAAVEYVSSDFTRMDAVTEAARSIRDLAPEGIDLLINNAGVPGGPQRIITIDGWERTLQVNALAPALLTRLLVPSLAEHSRIVIVGSSAHRVESFHFEDIDLARDYTPVAAYARSKLAMVTCSSLLAEELAGTSTTVVALCPGLNDTPLSAAMMGRIGERPTVGAERVVFAATADVASGSYLEGSRVVAPSTEVTDPANREALIALYRERLAPFAAGGRAAESSPTSSRAGDPVTRRA